VWFLRDLWPGAGWGLVDAAGAAKPCWYALRRACAPIAIAITDEGVNGLALHVANDRGAPLAGTLELVAWRHGEIEVARASREVAVAPHAAMELAAASLFDHFVDLSWAHKFGPPPAQVVHAVLRAGETIVGEAFAFPAGLALPAELDVGLSATAVASADGAAAYLTVRSRRFAQFVSIEAPGFAPDDDHFHLAPGQARVIALARQAPGGTPIRGHVRALNAEVTAKIELG
jgi:beta-mannosidase